MLLLILVLWIALLGVLLHASYRAFRKHKKLEGGLILLAVIIIAMYTGGYALFSAWTIGCDMGLFGQCML